MMTVTQIVEEIRRVHPCFGGGHVTPDNPISFALKDNRVVFAAGVDVEKVVRLVLDCADRP